MLRKNLTIDFVKNVQKNKNMTDCITEGGERNYFIRHGDKDYSFTDCVSFVTMSEIKLKLVLTSARHFMQAGFEPV